MKGVTDTRSGCIRKQAYQAAKGMRWDLGKAEGKLSHSDERAEGWGT